MRALLRVEARQLLAHRGRSLVVLLLVAVPVAALVGGATLLRIVEPTVEEARSAALGAAALRIAPGDAGAESLLPAAARVEPIGQGIERVTVPGRRLLGRLFAASPGAFDATGLGRGLLHFRSGRAPATDGEVALSPVLLAGLARRVGETVTLADGRPRRITGEVVEPEALLAPVVVRLPATDEDEGRGEGFLLASLPDAEVAPAVGRLRAAGFTVATRTDSGGRGETMTLVVYLLGALGLVEAALVVAAAFAVGLRRRRREIGLLGSVGASPRRMTAAMLAAAAAQGVAGAAAGSALGVAGAAALHPFLDGWLHRRVGPFEVPFEHVVAAAALGVAATMAAVAIPAWHATRLPVREALGGRRPTTAPSRRLLVAGLGLQALALGLVLLLPRTGALSASLAVIGGPLLGVVGLGVLSPWLLVGLAQGAGRLPLAWRLAVRDSGRAASRNGPVVTAVLAGMAMSVTLAVLITSVESRHGASPAPYRDDQLFVDGPGAEEVARRIEREFGARAIAPLAVAYAEGLPLRVVAGRGAGQRADWIVAGDDRLLRALDVEEGAGPFGRGALLVLGAATGGAADTVRLLAGNAGRPLAWPATARVTATQNVVLPAYVVAASALEARGLGTGPPPRRVLVPWIVRLDRPVTTAALARAQGLAATAPGTAVDAAFTHRRPANTIYALLLAGCFVTGLVVVLLATALSAVESAADERVLHTLGAAPDLLRRHRAARAGYLALLGCGLALPAGLLPALGLLASSNVRLAVVVPWRDLALVLLGMPALAWAVSWLAAARRAR